RHACRRSDTDGAGVQSRGRRGVYRLTSWACRFSICKSSSTVEFWFGEDIMAKKVTGSVKLQIAAGKATPAPPVGPALGQAQINIMEFCKQFNARTSAKELEGLIIPVVVSVYNDRSFTFVTKTPPASILLKRAAGIAKGSGAPNKDKVGKVTAKQVEEIARQKMPDWNAASVDAAVKSVRGTARSTGIDVVGKRA